MYFLGNHYLYSGYLVYGEHEGVFILGGGGDSLIVFTIKRLRVFNEGVLLYVFGILVPRILESNLSQRLRSAYSAIVKE